MSYRDESYRDISPWQQVGQAEWALPGTPWSVVRDQDGGWQCLRDGQQQTRFAKFEDARQHIETVLQTEGGPPLA